jgi:uncharacterized membrane protein (UPF0127 family)
MAKFMFLCVLLTLFACQSGSPLSDSGSQVILVTPSGENIKTKIALTLKEQEQGLSGVKPDDFGEDEGLIFFYLDEGDRHFWMPDTYFDLDLIFLDKNLEVRDIIRKLPHHKGRANTELIPRARTVWARHVLEMKSSSRISNKIQIGQKLEWKGDLSLQEFEDNLKTNKLQVR